MICKNKVVFGHTNNAQSLKAYYFLQVCSQDMPLEISRYYGSGPSFHHS